ncbi:diaminopimelate epimerase [Cytobacillus horneckiae]|uniref:Diaminopimelate epimerase n=1 Tax=Cytobacillus horneckiae TaxID=549687 RepID=A0A2N0ZL74_9BACI|nr:diaminopimelate epimerase [Cytobacillus horneckiae]MEC1156193.1 diaminopimelate epimerase [Cytobacillus horneckiae]MED2938211.1 diaminopimelate epimerase [Cytobacillus horneckiae]PKG30265.1 diaminopimelate epimerase [Cytobacillus horneckiae]
MKIELTKCHGSGNDFFIIDEMNHSYDLDDNKRAALARAFCNRSTDLGADGILFVLASDVSDAKMRVFNTDGSEASMCGNGLRCVARYVCEKLSIEEATIETMKANLQVKNQPDIFENIPTYLVEISPVSFDLDSLPLKLNQNQLMNEKIPALSENIQFTALSVPNPHLVAIVEKEQIQSNEQETLSKYVNGENEFFPDGVNVSFVKPLKKGHIYVRTFERGVGFTNACGTAMSASSLVTCLQGLNEMETPIEVYNNGGKVRCVVHEQNGLQSIDLIGNASYLYRCDVELEIENPEIFTIDNNKEYVEEVMQYAKLQKHAAEFLNEWINA